VTAASPGSMKTFNEQIIDEFRANGGQVGGPFQGAPLVLLTTTGAKTGQPRTSPVVHGTDGDRIYVIASKAGADTNPDWFHNLVANPEVTVELGTETFSATAEVVEEPERARLYAKMVGAMPGFGEYQEKTDRVIPVVILNR